MGKYFTFHKTVKGHLHGMKGIPCEDYSESYPERDAVEGGLFHIAVVADGHGDTACMRSSRGSQKAAEIAKDCLIKFAEGVMNGEQDSVDEQNPDRYKGYRSLREMLANAAVYGKDEDAKTKNILKARVPESLTNTIVSSWRAFVKDDISQNPLSDEEIAQAGRYADAYREGERLAHVYGTTLIAALMLPDFLLLIQQGDGRCDVFYEDGTVDQPIPWDERCHENVTTSMCDEDAPTSIRSRVIDLREKKVIACYLGSDGVEDAYRDMEGTHMFYRNLTCELAERGEDAFEAYLDEMLPGFSQTGSGDDVSVSGIVDMERVKDFVPSFRMQNEQYNRKEELARYESRIISMSRKHGILCERMEDAKKECGQMEDQLKVAVDECNEIAGMYEKAVAKADRWKQQWTTWENELDQLKEERRKSIDIIAGLFDNKRSNSRFSKPQEYEDYCRKKIKERESSLKKYYPEYIKVCEEETNLDDKVCEQKRKVSSLEQSLKYAKRQFQEARREFEEYNNEYKSIQEKIDRIKEEINHTTNKIPEEYTTTQEQAPAPPPEETDSVVPECRGAEIIHDGQDTPTDSGAQGKISEELPTDSDVQENISEELPADADEQENTGEDIPISSNEQENISEEIPISSNEQENISEEILADADEQENTSEDTPMSSDEQENITEDIPISFNEQEDTNEDNPASPDIQEQAGFDVQEQAQAEVTESTREEPEVADRQDHEPQAESAGTAYNEETL